MILLSFRDSTVKTSAFTGKSATTDVTSGGQEILGSFEKKKKKKKFQSDDGRS